MTPQEAPWVPDYETELVEVHGQEWPRVLVQKYERNGRGERRYVGSRFYDADGAQQERERLRAEALKLPRWDEITLSQVNALLADPEDDR